MPKSALNPDSETNVLTLEELGRIVEECYANKCDRFDGPVEIVPGVVRKSSTYRMSDRLVRTDWKEIIT